MTFFSNGEGDLVDERLLILLCMRLVKRLVDSCRLRNVTVFFVLISLKTGVVCLLEYSYDSLSIVVMTKEWFAGWDEDDEAPMSDVMLSTRRLVGLFSPPVLLPSVLTASFSDERTDAEERVDAVDCVEGVGEGLSRDEDGLGFVPAVSKFFSDFKCCISIIVAMCFGN